MEIGNWGCHFDTITDGKRLKMIHVNHLQQRIQTDVDDPQSDMVANHTTWQPPSVEHPLITEQDNVGPRLVAEEEPKEEGCNLSQV